MASSTLSGDSGRVTTRLCTPRPNSRVPLKTVPERKSARLAESASLPNTRRQSTLTLWVRSPWRCTVKLSWRGVSLLPSAAVRPLPSRARRASSLIRLPVARSWTTVMPGVLVAITTCRPSVGS
ncbi:hypothetical protein thsps21_17250 [Pseudomonas sp. No.21]